MKFTALIRYTNVKRVSRKENKLSLFGIRSLHTLEDDLALVVHNFVILLLEHPGLTLVQLACHPQHITLLDLELGPLAPAVLILFHLGVSLGLMLPEHKDVIDKLLDICIEQLGNLVLTRNSLLKHFNDS